MEDRRMAEYSEIFEDAEDNFYRSGNFLPKKQKGLRGIPLKRHRMSRGASKNTRRFPDYKGDDYKSLLLQG